MGTMMGRSAGKGERECSITPTKKLSTEDAKRSTMRVLSFEVPRFDKYVYQATSRLAPPTLAAHETITAIGEKAFHQASCDPTQYRPSKMPEAREHGKTKADLQANLSTLRGTPSSAGIPIRNMTKKAKKPGLPSGKRDEIFLRRRICQKNDIPSTTNI